MKLRRVLLLVGAAIALGAGFGGLSGTASAAYVHPSITASFGPDGTSGSSFSSINRIALQQSNKHLYVLDGGASKIYGFNNSTPGTYTPLTGNFPITVPGTGGDPDLAVDNSGSGSAGNLYYLSEANGASAFDPGGNALFSIERSNFGDPCGIAVDADGNIWVADYGARKIYSFPSTGGGASNFFSVAEQGSPCHIGADPGTGDIYVSNWNGATYRYTAASNYTVKNLIDPGSTRAITVDAVTHRVYIVHSNGVDVYEPNGSRVEEFATSGGNWIGAAVDGATGIVYLADQSTNQIKVLPGIVVPDVTTGEPTGFATLHGHVDPAGGGQVTGCKFEVSTSPEYTTPTTQEVPCTPAAPFSTAQNVEADLTGTVSGEVLYHYRLKASNASGSNVSADQTFTPHYVAGLHTDPATDLERKGATLNGSFLGNGEDTHYYFKWGTSTSYGNTTPVEDAGSPTGQTTVAPAILSNVLQPQTVYHYKIVATNGKGTSEANDATFETEPAVFGLSTDAASNIKTETADLNGSFTGDGLNTKYWFEYGSSALYGSKSAEGEVTDPTGAVSVPPIEIAELQPLHAYHFRIVAENSFGKTLGPDKTFTTFTAPVIISQTTSGVTATDAELHAVINPHGAEAEYHFEYGTTTQYGNSIPIPDEQIPAENVPVPVEQHLTGLTGGVYHFRIVAKNVYGESVSKDQTFNFYPPSCANSTVRQQTGASSLPDCRAYELVTPEDQGITIVYAATMPSSARATSPSKLMFGGAYGSVPGSGEPANNAGDAYVSTRTSNGWKTKYVGLPSSATSLAGSPPWHLPIGDLGAYEPDKWNQDTLTNPSMSAFVDWNDGYFKNGELFEETEHTDSSNAPYVWNTSTGKQIDRWPTNVGAVPGGEHFKGTTAASADLSHFVFTSNIPFTVDGEPGDMYDNNTATGSIKVVSLKADNTTHIPGTFPLKVSEDGSHILMGVGTGTNPPPYNGAGELYMRVNDERTYEIAPGHSLQFLEMTADGKKVFFTTSDPLTPEDTDTSQDLYMWEEDGSPTGRLVEVSKGNEPTAGNTDACSASWTTKCGIQPISFKEYTKQQGGKGGSPYADNYVSPENGDIYYLSPEQLAGNNGINGQENLYVFRNGKNQFVAALEPSKIPCTVNQIEVCAENSVARMETNPDDTQMAFLTSSNVTGYDSTGHSEMYHYVPASGEMTCVSCVPTGEPPSSNVLGSHNGRFMSDDGRTFFETEDSLVPQDTNDATDVYEYGDGRPQLITSGTNVGNNTFGLATIMAIPGLVGVSADGTDVYFSTYDVLVGQDRNGEAIKIYDARSGGGFQFTPPVPPCVAADECHGPSSEAPAEAPNGTGAELGGSGNVQSTPGGGSGNKSKKQRHKRHHRKRDQKKRHHKARANSRKDGRRNG